MAASVTASFQSSNVKAVFLGDRSRLCRRSVSVTRVGFPRTIIQCRERPEGKPPKESRVGKQPIKVPSTVTLTLEGQDLNVKGPLGELSLSYPEEVMLVREENGVIRIKKTVENRRANQMHGLFRTLTNNLVVGVSTGFEKRLLLIGVGYRAAMEGNDLVLNLGFCHPVRMPVPDDLKVKVEEGTTIIISGYEKSHIGQFAANIRKWRPPEPYKGKGVRYADEVIKLKEGKAGKKKQ